MHPRSNPPPGPAHAGIAPEGAVGASAPTIPAPAPAVEVRGLVKNYGKVEALRGVDLTVQTGEMFALLGPNGAGKTTLFSVLATLRAPTAGTASVLGHDVVGARDAIRREMGIVFQEPAIEQRLSGRDNLVLMGLLFGLPLGGARRRAAELLAELGLAEAADRPARALSGGQRRKLELARALVINPRILFLDEATLGLDVDARRGFWVQIRALAAAGRTVFFTTHYMEEADVADRIALIDGGRIVALDPPGALKARLGGGVIRLKTADDAVAADWLIGRGFHPERHAAGLRLMHADPAAVLPEIFRHLPVAVERVEVNAPSLEDVFVTLTGRGLGGEGAAPAGRPAGAPGGARDRGAA